MIDLIITTNRPNWDVCKENAAVLLIQPQPDLSASIADNIKTFRYCWYVILPGVRVEGEPTANMEEVAVFYRKAPTYNPQGLKKKPPDKIRTVVQQANPKLVYGGLQDKDGSLVGNAFRSEYEGYPHQTLSFGGDRDLLYEYMIRSYTNPGETVGIGLGMQSASWRQLVESLDRRFELV